MPGIFWMGGVKVADYAANIRGGKTTLVIKLSVTDTHELAHLIDQLEAANGKPTKKAPLMIADQRD